MAQTMDLAEAARMADAAERAQAIMKSRVQEPSNPLAGFFRQPGIHITLPSRGYFNSEDDFTFTQSNELPVYPMTGKDEIILKSPDALLNGHAIIEVIKSCVPGIHNPLTLPTPDVDAVLLAIRMSTHSDDLEFTVKCPKCGETSEVSLSIAKAINSMAFLNDSYSVELGGVTAFLRPYTLQSQIQAAQVAFEEANMIRSIQATGKADVKDMESFNKSFHKVAELNRKLYVESIIHIQIPNGTTVTDKKNIREFIDNLDAKRVRAIESKLTEINQTGVNRKWPVQCSHCQHQWTNEFTFNPTDFFG